MFTHVLVAIDDSECANRALDAAIDVAAGGHAALTIVHVIDPLQALAPTVDPYASMQPWLEELVKLGNELLAGAQKRAAERGVENAATILREGNPTATIVDLAKSERCDLVTIGSHGRKGLSRLVLGSVAEGVMRSAPCPVLVVREIEAAVTAGA